MSSHQAEGNRALLRVQCACGRTFKGPWELTAHLLAVYPPKARQSSDDSQHADATRLGAKLDTGSSGAWEVVTWAGDSRKDLRVAAWIAYRIKARELKRFDTIVRQDIRDTYKVSLDVAGRAINVLMDYGVFMDYGTRNGVACDDVDEAICGHFSYGQLLDTVIRQVAKLEDEVAALRDSARPSPVHEAGTS
jgi:hypothetical protein